MFYCIQALYYVIPIAALIFFTVSLFRFCHAKRENKRNPEAFSFEELKIRKICLVVSSVIMGILAAVVFAFIGLMMIAVAFM